MDFRARQIIETAENIPLVLELAGLAARIFAAAIDAILMTLLTGALSLALWTGSIASGSPELAKTLLPVGALLILLGYHPLQEWRWNGRTVGKAILGIRVVRDNGQPIGFWEALGRGLMRVVDIGMDAGLLCMMFNSREKRLGDWLVGTVVIRDKVVQRPQLGSSLLSMGALRDEDVDSSVAFSRERLTVEELALVEEYLARRGTMFKKPRQDLAADLCRYFSGRLGRELSETDLDVLYQSLILNPRTS